MTEGVCVSEKCTKSVTSGPATKETFCDMGLGTVFGLKVALDDSSVIRQGSLLFPSTSLAWFATKVRRIVWLRGPCVLGTSQTQPTLLN